MAKKLTIVLALLGFSSPAFSGSLNSQFHLRLLDRLDRPEDGYCVDILGTPGNLRIDVPLFAHNCKPRLLNEFLSITSLENHRGR